MDVRLKSLPFDFKGQTYNLVCNFNVLADVQEEYGGDFSRALTGKVRPLMVFLTAMINDAADTAGYPEHFTTREIGRELCSMADLKRVKDVVVPLVTAAVAGDDEPAQEESSGKN